MAEKIKTPVCAEAIKIMTERDYFRVVVFGASNTERYMPGTHWSDVLEVGIRSAYGRKFHLINAGVSGNNTRDGLSRFERDVASFSPDIVIVTFAGNDCNPNPPKYVPEDEFNANMDLIISKIKNIGALPILQTYYKIDYANIDPKRAELAQRYMTLVREAAARNNVFLVDQFKYFDAVHKDMLLYKLLLNPMHVNEYGNTFIGVNLLHHLGIDPQKIGHNEPILPAIALYDSIAE